ncbi:MAG: hypothetical protein J1F03_04900 [Oscillospiraceae bacterium]|nr:hypothetical protein [Oscillospiraceae bacterium]
MRLKKIMAAVLAAFCAAAFAGCSVKFGTNPQVSPETVVAKPTRMSFTGELEITFKEFNSEYLFYLNSYGITEDPSNADMCRELRDTIINNIIYDKVLLLKAKEYGCDELTEKEKEEVQSDFEEDIQLQIKDLGESADYSDLPEGTEITDEMKLERGKLEFEKILESCDLTREDIYNWIKNYKISQKMLKKIKDDLDPQEAEDILNEYIEQIKGIYEADPALYEQGDYYTFWAPEGSRRIKHVLLGFDDETIAKIREYREAENDEAADALREEKAAELKEKQAAVEKALDDGTDWNDILLKYSADATGSSLYPDGYLVVPNGQSYVKEFQEAAFVPEKIGDRTTCVSDYGLHIMIYAGSGEVSEEERGNIIDYLNSNLAQNEFAAKMAKWVDEYAFEIDKDALRLNEDSDSESLS